LFDFSRMILYKFDRQKKPHKGEHP